MFSRLYAVMYPYVPNQRETASNLAVVRCRNDNPARSAHNLRQLVTVNARCNDSDSDRIMSHIHLGMSSFMIQWKTAQYRPPTRQGWRGQNVVNPARRSEPM